MTNLKYLTGLSLLLLLSNFLFSQGWVQLNSGTSLNLNSVYFNDANTGYICADSGKVLKTTNGGINWMFVNTSIMRTLYKITFINAATGFIAVNNKVLRTTNAGLSWDTTINGGGKSISFINASTGYALRELNLKSLWKTTNSGSSWDSVGMIPIPIGNVNKIYFTDELTGYFCGYLYTLSFMTYNALINKTTNGGMDWNGGGYSGPTGLNYSAIFDLNFQSNNGFALGIESGINYLYKTTNASNWIKISLPHAMYSVKFTDANTGWLCGENGKIMYSTNTGISWSEQTSATSSVLNEIYMVNNTTGYIAGQNGVILKTTNGGITGVHQTGSNIPDKYSLSQNYPNPFNPVTQIKFDLPKASMVNIIIYNSLGKEIEQVISKELSTGSYSVDWDASLNPSGVYFYKITAGEFSQTRKMVLVK